MSNAPSFPDWASYDAVAGDYDRAVPPSYGLLARDLVDALRLRAGDRVLDVGTGTGAGALLAAERTAPAGTVVGVDPSIGMLRVTRAKGAARIVVAGAPGLPFPAGVFDAVLANLVLSHFADHQAALGDMVRVLAPGGRLGATAWAAGAPSEHHRLWMATAEAWVGRDAIRDAIRRSVPWEDLFGSPTSVRDALRGAGLERVEVESRAYPLSRPAADFLRLMEISSPGRFLQRALPAARWEEFRTGVAAEFRARLPPLLVTTAHAHFAVGTKR